MSESGSGCEYLLNELTRKTGREVNKNLKLPALLRPIIMRHTSRIESTVEAIKLELELLLCFIFYELPAQWQRESNSQI